MWNLHRLRLLRELQQRKTVTAVAAALNYSPSTVSAQLAQLEREVGVPLLEPDGRRVRLTAQGIAVARHAARVMDLEEVLRAELEALRTATETVRIATLETVARTLLPAALDRLALRHPGLRVEATVLPPEIGLFELESRGFDLAIAEQYPGQTRRHRVGVDRVRLGLDPIRLAVPRNCPVTALAELAGYAWVCEPADTEISRWVRRQCREAGFEPDVRYVAADLAVHTHLVAGGHAVSLIPDLAWAGERDRVRLLELPGSPRRELFTSVRTVSAGSPALRAVRTALADAFAALSG
jgi:DNA-binding transcriptional LysR family regulator